MVNFFIERPIFASVIALVMVLVGAIAATLLPVAQFPPIAPPQIAVTSNYAGASAQIVADTVTTPLEQQINGVEGMTYMSSYSANDGTSTITITFDIGYPLNTAAVDVQNRVDRAKPILPDVVTKTGVTTAKRQPSIMLVVSLFSPDDSQDQVFISNYAALRVVDALKRVPGVGDAQIFGEKRYSIRIWLNPERLARLNLTAADIQRAVQEQNAQVAAGKLGQSPAPKGQAFEYQINAQGRLTEAAEFENIIVRAAPGAAAVRLKDVARVELGSQDYGSAAFYNGKPTVGVGIYQLPSANALSTATAIRQAMDQMKTQFPKGLDYAIPYDTTKFVDAAVEEVITTLGEAMILVFVVVFVFLQSWRTTLIAAITVPVSLIGTFAIMLVLGFSINMLSLLGMVLAIGLVVDDAIVVVENVERQLENGLSPLQAAKVAMAEVTGPIIATSLVLMAVFVPVAFIPGLSGRLYNQFALTIAVSVGLSTINSLTLSPALCAVLLRHIADEDRNVAARMFNNGFRRLALAYESSVRSTARVWPLMLLLFAGTIVGTIYLLNGRPSAFLPDEDQGYFFTVINGPDGASTERTQDVALKAADILGKQAEVEATFAIAGYNFLTGTTQSNSGVVFAALKPWAQRKDPNSSAVAVVNRVRGMLFAIPDAFVLALNAPPVQGLSATGGFEFVVQDVSGVGAQALADATNALIQRSRAEPSVAGLFTTYTTNVPQFFLDLDREKIKLLDLSLSDVFSALQIYLGSLYVNDFTLYGRSYRVILQGEADTRDDVRDLSKIQVKNGGGQMIPLNVFASLRPISGPATVPHYNLYPSAFINGSPAPGYSSGAAIATMERLAAETLPRGISYAWTGVTFQEIKAGNLAMVIFGLALVFVFLFLAAQYESWLMPFMVLLAVPLALFGASVGLTARNFNMDVYGQIGLVMLIGLAAKNAILIVEFARRRREEGLGVVEAAMEAARLRLRPILMTAFAFILGVVPLVIATGAGAGGRQSLGTTVFSGMLAGTLLALVFVPVFYVIIERLRSGDTPGNAGDSEGDAPASGRTSAPAAMPGE